MSARAAAAAAVTLAAALAAPAPAAAFERMTTDQGVPLFWPSSCAYFTLDAAGSDDIPIDILAAVMVGAFNAWGSIPDAYLTFQYQGLESNTRAGWFGGGPNENIIHFVEADWANTADPDNARPPGTIALTTVSFDTSGAIIGADMELNGEDFTFTTSSDPGMVIIDLANTVTHEAGHFIGVHHNCFAPGSGLVAGQAPDCTSDPSLLEATMYWSADPGELKKRSLEPDDILAASTIYPLADDPGRCEEPGFLGGGGGTCNCRMVGGARAGAASGGMWSAAALALALLGVVVVRGARRRSPVVGAAHGRPARGRAARGSQQPRETTV